MNTPIWTVEHFCIMQCLKVLSGMITNPVTVPFVGLSKKLKLHCSVLVGFRSWLKLNLIRKIVSIKIKLI